MNELQQTEDLKLINSFIGGNDSAFEILVRRYRQEIYEAIYFIVRERCLAEDILQDVFIRIVRSLRTNGYEDKGRFPGWALTIARNLCFDHKRKLRRRPAIHYSGEVFGATYTDRTDSVNRMERKQLEQHIEQALRRLPEEQRMVIRCRHFEQMSFREISSAMGASINTTMGRMRYGLHNLRLLIDGQRSMFQ